MKSVGAIFLLTIFLVQSFSTYFIQADFFLNRLYIANNLCVNKDKPVMKCNGKCYLTKKLKEQQNKDQDVPVNKNQRPEMQPFLVVESIILVKENTTNKLLFPHKNEMWQYSYQPIIFHPPTV